MFPIQKAAQDAAMLLLFFDEEAERGYEPRIRSQCGMSCRPADKSAPARIFAELELLNGSADCTPLAGC